MPTATQATDTRPADGDVLPAVRELREEADEWIVEWDDGSERTTTLAGIAWYAREFDSEATVRPVE